MEKNLALRVSETIANALMTQLASLRADAEKRGDDEPNAAHVMYNVNDLLRYCGAVDIQTELRCHKGYTFVRVLAADESGIYFPFEFGARRQMTQAQYKALEKNPEVDATMCVAGVFFGDEGDRRFSFKWDSLVIDAERVTFGAVRKYNAETGSYDAPISDAK